MEVYVAVAAFLPVPGVGAGAGADAGAHRRQLAPLSLLGSNSILVVMLGFRTDLGRETYNPCSTSCVLNNLWDATPSVASLLADSSDGAFVLDKGASLVLPLQIDLFASTLGCVTAQWESRANTLLLASGLDPNNFVLKCVSLRPSHPPPPCCAPAPPPHPLLSPPRGVCVCVWGGGHV